MTNTYIDIIMRYLDLVIESYEQDMKIWCPGAHPGQFHLMLRELWNKAKEESK